MRMTPMTPMKRTTRITTLLQRLGAKLGLRVSPQFVAALAIAAAIAFSAGVAFAEDESIERKVERGPVTATIRVTPAQPRIGDPITLEFEVSSEPGVEVFMPEFGQAMDRFAIIDFAPSDFAGDDGRTVTLQRYTLEAPRSGQLAIPPLMIEFVDHRPDHEPAPEGEDAYEILTDRVSFEVASVLPDDADADLAPPRAKLDPLPSDGPAWWMWVLAVLALGAGGMFAWKRTAAWRERARLQSAYEAATTRLAALQRYARATPEDMEAFFVELSALVRRYVEDRFRLRAPELTTEEFLQIASASPDLTDAHRGFLQDFLSLADQVKFARLVPGEADAERLLLAANRFVEETRDDDAEASSKGA
ncbi:MAG: hypothetical protein ACI8TX_003375 [Hyphomicrobiaceae bacterium]|jgi:hypothetical protein